MHANCISYVKYFLPFYIKFKMLCQLHWVKVLGSKCWYKNHVKQCFILNDLYIEWIRISRRFNVHKRRDHNLHYYEFEILVILSYWILYIHLIDFKTNIKFESKLLMHSPKLIIKSLSLLLADIEHRAGKYFFWVELIWRIYK